MLLAVIGQTDTRLYVTEADIYGGHWTSPLSLAVPSFAAGRDVPLGGRSFLCETRI